MTPEARHIKYTTGYARSSYRYPLHLYAHVTPPTQVRTNSPSGSRTRDAGAGGGRSIKERQRLQPLASVARAPLFEVRRVRFTHSPYWHTSVTPRPEQRNLQISKNIKTLWVQSTLARDRKTLLPYRKTHLSAAEQNSSIVFSLSPNM